MFVIDRDTSKSGPTLTVFVLRVGHHGLDHGLRGDDLVLLTPGTCHGHLRDVLEDLDHRDVAEALGDGQWGLTGLQRTDTRNDCWSLSDHGSVTDHVVWLSSSRGALKIEIQSF